MSMYRTRALVLKTRNLGEADRVLLLLTEDHGKLEAAVKGARRQRSRFVGNTLPFNLIHAMFFTGKNLDQLSQAQLIHSFAVLREDLVKMAYASYWAELVGEFVPERENVREIFRFMLAALITLEKSDTPELLNLAFQIRILNYLGYQPELENCVSCGDGSAVVQFSPIEGGVVCRQCAADLRDLIPVNRADIRFLIALSATDIRKLAEIDQTGVQLGTIRALLRRFIEARLDKPLKTQVFLDSVLA